MLSSYSKEIPSLVSEESGTLVITDENNALQNVNEGISENDQLNKDNNISKSNGNVSGLLKDSSINKQCKITLTIHDNDDENEVTILEEKN